MNIRPHDFTDVLPEDWSTYRFNPSISHWKDNLYLCAYRVFARYPELDQRGEDDGITWDYTKQPMLNPNHPWLGGPGARTWWNMGYGYDSTAFALLEMTPTGFRRVKQYDEDGSVQMEVAPGVWRDERDILLYTLGVDPRLLKIKDDGFVLSYNANAVDPNFRVKGGQPCGSGCFIIATSYVEIHPTTYVLRVHRRTFLCPEQSHTTEKNWSFWQFQNSLQYTYNLYPSHDVMQVALTPDGTFKCEGSYVYSNPSSFFRKFVEYYNGKVHISVTTPAIPLEPDVYVGVGHVKYEYDNFTLRAMPPDSPLVKFTKVNLKKKLHPMFVYMMYFYAFVPATGKVLAISDIFSPPSDYLLAFPSGLTYTNNLNDMIVSYGEGDVRCKYFTANREQVRGLLKYQTNQTQPQDVDFIMFV